MSFGERLRSALARREMTQRALAEEIETTEVTVSRWCQDKRSPKVTDLERICKAIKISADWLLDI